MGLDLECPAFDFWNADIDFVLGLAAVSVCFSVGTISPLLWEEIIGHVEWRLCFAFLSQSLVVLREIAEVTYGLFSMGTNLSRDEVTVLDSLFCVSCFSLKSMGDSTGVSDVPDDDVTSWVATLQRLLLVPGLWRDNPTDTDVFRECI